MSSNWYTYRSHPHKEGFLCRQLESIGLDFYYPSLKVTPVNPRSKTIRPYFPGYLFIYVDLEMIGLSTLQFMPYSKGLVQFGGEPAIVPDHLIQTIRKKLGTLNDHDLDSRQSGFSHGEKVVVVDGILDGYEAMFDESLSGNERSRILLKTLNNYAIKLEIANKSLRKKNNG